MYRFTILLLFLFLVLFSHALFLLHKSWECKSWSKYDATVIHSSLETKLVHVSDTDSKGRNASSYEYRDFISIKYKYFVSNVEYNNDCITIGKFHENDIESSWEDFIKSYKVGNVIEVHVNPKNNSDAVILPIITKGSWYYLFVCLFFIILVSVILLRGPSD